MRYYNIFIAILAQDALGPTSAQVATLDGCATLLAAMGRLMAVNDVGSNSVNIAVRDQRGRRCLEVNTKI